MSLAKGLFNKGQLCLFLPLSEQSWFYDKLRAKVIVSACLLRDRIRVTLKPGTTYNLLVFHAVPSHYFVPNSLFSRLVSYLGLNFPGTG